MEAPDEEIKRKYRNFTKILHPDKVYEPSKKESAYEAFHVVE